MSKELTPLEALEKLSYGIISQEVYKTIETALKSYEELTSKPVILYERTHGSSQALIDYICKNHKEVKIINLEDEKKLKALEIIKEKRVDVIVVCLSPSCKAYNKAKTDISLDLDETQFGLLKEVLI